MTLVALLGTLGLSIAGRLDRAPPPSPAPTAPVAPREDAEARRGLAILASRVAALETSPAKVARVDASYDRRSSCRITNRKEGLVAEVREPAASGAERGAVAVPRKLALSTETGSARIVIAQDLGPAGADRHGLLLVQALVRTDNGIREKENHPHRLVLACVDRGGAEQQWDLAGCYFMAVSQPQDLLLKTAANTCTFAVTEGARLELLVDAATLKGYLTEGGLFEVDFRLGPLVLFDGPVTR